MALTNNKKTNVPQGQTSKVNNGREEDLDEELRSSPFSIDGIRTGAMQSKIAKTFVVIAGLVLAGGFIISSLNAPSNPGGGGGAPRGTAATVGSQQVSALQLANAFERQKSFYEQMGQKVGVTDFLSSRQSALRQLTDTAAYTEAALQKGVSVSEAEIDAKLQEELDKVLKPEGGQNPAAVRRQLEAQFGSVDNWMQETRKNIDREAVRKQLLVEKLEKQVKDENKVTEADYKRSVTKLKLYHMVLRPKFPAPTAKDFKTEQEKNNKDVAERATKLMAELKAKPALLDFKRTAIAKSDDEPTKKKGGDLGWKLPSEIPAGPEVGRTLSETATKLAGPFSDSAGNQYLFFIESRQEALPADFAKNKKKLLEDFETQRDNETLTKMQEEWKKSYTPQVSDPALAAYQIQTEQVNTVTGEEQKKLQQEAIARYQEALRGVEGTEAAAIGYQLAQLYQATADKPKQLESLTNAVKAREDDAQLRLELARSLRENGKPKEAVQHLKEASKALDNAPPPPAMFGGYNPSDAVRQQVATEFEMVKEPKLAAAERAKIVPQAPNPSMGGMGGMGGMSSGNIQIR